MASSGLRILQELDSATSGSTSTTGGFFSQQNNRNPSQTADQQQHNDSGIDSQTAIVVIMALLVIAFVFTLSSFYLILHTNRSRQRALEAQRDDCSLCKEPTKSSRKSQHIFKVMPRPPSFICGSSTGSKGNSNSSGHSRSRGNNRSYPRNLNNSRTSSAAKKSMYSLSSGAKQIIHSDTIHINHEQFDAESGISSFVHNEGDDQSDPGLMLFEEDGSDTGPDKSMLNLYNDGNDRRSQSKTDSDSHSDSDGDSDCGTLDNSTKIFEDAKIDVVQYNKDESADAMGEVDIEKQGEQRKQQQVAETDAPSAMSASDQSHLRTEASASVTDDVVSVMTDTADDLESVETSFATTDDMPTRTAESLLQPLPFDDASIVSSSSSFLESKKDYIPDGAALV